MIGAATARERRTAHRSLAVAAPITQLAPLDSLMDVKLVVQKTGAPQAFAMRGPEMIIGRQKGSGVRIPSAEVSRQHCLLVCEGELLRVEDLSSANGTFINGRRISRREVLRPGDKLRVGPVTFVVHYQLSQAALGQLLSESEEHLEAVPLDEVEVADEGVAEVELVLDGEDQMPLTADEDEPTAARADPLEALRQIEAAASAPPPAKKPVKKPTPPPKKPAPPKRRTPPPVPQAEPEFDDVEVLGDAGAEPPKRVKLSQIEPAASDDEPIAVTPVDDAETAHPDASIILGQQNWQIPAGQDIRDILAQLEKGKKA